MHHNNEPLLSTEDQIELYVQLKKLSDLHVLLQSVEIHPNPDLPYYTGMEAEFAERETDLALFLSPFLPQHTHRPLLTPYSQTHRRLDSRLGRYVASIRLANSIAVPAEFEKLVHQINSAQSLLFGTLWYTRDQFLSYFRRLLKQNLSLLPFEDT